MNLEARATEALHELSRELTLCFGWTLLEVDVHRVEPERLLVARGTVLAPRTRDVVIERLAALVPPDWRLEASEIRAHRTGDHRALPGLVRLHRKLPGTGDNALATELLPDDGPVELLATEGERSLVHCIDATIGWTRDPLGERTDAPRIGASRGDAGSLGSELERWLGVPYVLGGARDAGIDCSALVQRCFRNALGIVLPRHSSDQLAFADRADAGRADDAAKSPTAETGDLLFVWTERERPCHVGIVRNGAVVHASLSRKRVVADPLTDFVAGARRVERVSWRELRVAHARFVGKASIDLPPRGSTP